MSSSASFWAIDKCNPQVRRSSKLFESRDVDRSEPRGSLARAAGQHTVVWDRIALAMTTKLGLRDVRSQDDDLAKHFRRGSVVVRRRRQALTRAR